MSSPGTGSTNQAQTITAFKRLLGKANTSAIKEFYEETIPSNIQLDTSTIFGQAIPQAVTTGALYAKFSASASDPVTAEYVEFYVESISGTTYDANTGTFGSVGFGAGDESQSSGPHSYQLVLTASYETLSSNSLKSTGYYVNDQIVNAANGKLQLISPSFGPQSGNNYALELYTAHPDNGGSRIYPTDPIDWQVDYYNGIVFIQDYSSTKVPTYARGFIYIGKYANNIITGISGAAANIIVKEEGSNVTTSVSSLNFVGSGITATNSGDDVTITVATGLSTKGPAGAIQFHSGSNDISGSSAMTYDGSTFFLSGSGSSYGEALSVSGSIVPSVSNVYDLGSPDRQWGSLYVSSSTIYFGGEALSVDSDGLKFGSGSASKAFKVGHLKLLDRGIVMDPNHIFDLKAFQTKLYGGLAYKRRTVSGNYQVVKTDYLIGVESNLLSNPMTITLPTAAACVDGQNFLIKDEGGAVTSNNIVITAKDGNSIDGEQSVTLSSNYGAINVYTDGSSKFFIH
tara:strand:+ start:660 stop:2201 length:1542 start_codon:yes stop_codon:yes gene_type:complete